MGFIGRSSLWLLCRKQTRDAWADVIGRAISKKFLQFWVNVPLHPLASITTAISLTPTSNWEKETLMRNSGSLNMSHPNPLSEYLFPQPEDAVINYSHKLIVMMKWYKGRLNDC